MRTVPLLRERQVVGIVTVFLQGNLKSIRRIVLLRKSMNLLGLLYHQKNEGRQ